MSIPLKNPTLRPGELRLDLPSKALALAYRDGATLPELAKAYGCSQASIRLRLIREGVELRKRGKYDRRLAEKKRAKKIREQATEPVAATRKTWEW